MSVATSQSITARDIEREIVSRSFLDFLKRVKLLEPPPGRGIIQFEFWPHLVELAGLLGTERLIELLKARQLGITWELAAYADWTAIYHDGAPVFLFSQGEKEANVFLGKSKFILTELPSHLTVPLGTDSASELTFPSMHSKITAFPSTEKAGRSETAALVIQDEADFHEHLDANYAAVKPTIDAGGQLVQVSTVNKKKMTSLFKQLYRGAPGNGFVKRFFGWRVRPGRDQAWYDRTRVEAPTTAEMSPELYMEQEYPATEEEALSPARALAAFDLDALKLMLEDCRSPVETLGIANIYQKFAVGKRYAAGTDTSHGTGGDDAVTAVIDVATGYVVADIKGSNISPEELAFQSVELLKAYNKPIWGIEDNDWGILTIRKAQELGYGHLYERKEDTVGWHTDEKTRYLLWGELIDAVKSRLITVPNREGLSQFTTVIRNPEKGGRIEGMQGTHDDYPLAVGIAWQMRKHAHGGVIKLRSITYAGT